MIRTASRLTLYEDLLNQLSDAIEKGMWTVGERIPGEKQLALQFNVSRSCICEAVKVLSDRGIVAARPGSGTYLLRKTMKSSSTERTKSYIFHGINLKEIIETRCLIEGQIAYYAAKRGTDEDFEELEFFLRDPGARRTCTRPISAFMGFWRRLPAKRFWSVCWRPFRTRYRFRGNGTRRFTTEC
jgi:GntR family transcriptional repressor for pyruvate dehydrogenase complex